MRLLQCAIVAAALRAAAPSGCVEIRLFDSFHDGWNGAAWSVRAWNATAIVASGTLADGASGAAAACVAAGCYVFEATAGDYESEISWDVGGAVSGNGAGAATVAVDDDGAVEARSCGAPWTPAPSAAPVAAAPAAAAAPEDDLAKRAKALKKKLKSVSELQAKVDGGLAPNAEQAEKLGRAAELRADLADVEARLARL